MSREYFVKKFIAGTAAASAKMNWWHRHSSATSAYLQASNGHSCPPEHAAIRDAARKSCGEWDVIVGANQGLMAEHSILELDFVDAALANPFNQGRQAAITEDLLQNAKKMTLLLGSKNPEFPVNHFRELLLEHVKLFVEAVRWYATPDDRKYAACEERRMRNTLSLAAFSTEWL